MLPLPNAMSAITDAVPMMIPSTDSAGAQFVQPQTAQRQGKAAAPLDPHPGAIRHKVRPPGKGFGWRGNDGFGRRVVSPIDSVERKLRARIIADVRLDSTVAHPHHPPRPRGDAVFMRDHDDRLARAVQVAEQLHDLVARARVEVTRGLISQNDLWIVDQCAGNRHALLLATRELRGTVIESLSETHHFRQLDAALACLLGDRASLIEQRNLDIFNDRVLGKKIVGLKNEADVAAAHFGELVVVDLGDIVVSQKVMTAGTSVETSEHIEKSGFP